MKGSDGKVVVSDKFTAIAIAVWLAWIVGWIVVIVAALAQMAWVYIWLGELPW